MRVRAASALPPALLLAVVVGLPAPADAASGVPYTLRGTIQDTFQESDGLCGIPETVTIDARYVLHVNATEAGLSEAEILEALFHEDPQGIFNSVSFKEHGTFAVQSGVHTYNGTYHVSFNLNENQNMDNATFTFSARGKSEEGTQLRAHFVGHGSETRQAGFERGHVKGCLA